MDAAAIKKRLSQVRRDRERLLAERDELVLMLRDAGATQAEIAEAADLSQQAVSKLLKRRWAEWRGREPLRGAALALERASE